MNKIARIVIIIVLVVAVGLVIILKQKKPSPTDLSSDNSVGGVQAAGLPCLVDLGAGKCVPCKMMEPILEELRTEYKDKFEVRLIDISKDMETARQYSIRTIPTQIFLDASGKELFRHEGFFGKEDILTKWRQLGMELTKAK